MFPKSKTLVYEGRTYKQMRTAPVLYVQDKELTTAKEDSLLGLYRDLSFNTRVGTVSVLEVKENNFYDFVRTKISPKS